MIIKHKDGKPMIEIDNLTLIIIFIIIACGFGHC